MASLPLSPTAKNRVWDFIDYAVSNMAEAFRNDPANRPQAGAPYLRLDFLILDAAGDGRFHKIDFVVSDEHAAVGVIILVYLDHQTV